MLERNAVHRERIDRRTKALHHVEIIRILVLKDPRPRRVAWFARQGHLSSRDAHRALKTMVREGTMVRLAHGLYAPAGSAWAEACENVEISRARTTIRRRLRLLLASPKTLPEILAMVDGLLAPHVLREMSEQGEIVSQLAPEGRLYRLPEPHPGGCNQHPAWIEAEIVTCLPPRPGVIRLSRISELLALRGRASLAQRARLKRHFRQLESEGQVEILPVLRRDWLVCRAPWCTRIPEDRNLVFPSEQVSDALGVCIVVLKMLSQNGSMGIVRLRELTGLSLACNSGILCRMLRAGMIRRRRLPKMVLYDISENGQLALAWHRRALWAASAKKKSHCVITNARL